jgi:AraC-like DNA-binding protein
MPGSVISAFTEAVDFEAALREGGCLGLLVTGPGTFRARLTRIALLRLRLSAAEEHLPRIAFVAVPADTILVGLPGGRGRPPVWGGMSIGPREIMTVGPGERLHMRSDGPSRWGAIRLPASELDRYGSVMTGTAFATPSAALRWSRPAATRHLRHLHSAAIGFVEGRSKALIDAETAHGLEQQLIETLVECLSQGPAIEASPPMRGRQEVALRFQALLEAEPERAFRVEGICCKLGISAQTLRLSCEEQLGMGPAEYVYRRRMESVHRALRRGNPDTASVADIARQCGFRGLRRFAAEYRTLYGEPPSATLRQGLGVLTKQPRQRRI